MMKKILIANRGEIARRIQHACRELGIASVAVHSEIDRDAPFAREADEAVALEGSSALDTYLNIEKILSAAKRAGADAVHPGYGFLSENAAFAQAVQDAGMLWIGPSPRTILQMGSKAQARELAQQAGVPVVPGFHESGPPSQLLAQARRLGFPVLIKASAGGGGKGMRVVESPEGFVEALQAAKQEARAAFGDDRLIVEKFSKNPRHVEVQVFGDAHGNVVHLFERECSIQRRHQKIVEESPSPALDETARRTAMTQAAVKLARAAGYCNAGTVEFILDESGAFHFLEMNTRLQVEHPVTEWVTGLDLAVLQLRIAAGEPLPFQQADLTQRGHAIEARLYAEDAENFTPQTGTLRVLRLGQGPGVRWDVGVEEGSVVSPHYDPLLGKLIVYGEDRPAAIRRLQKALHETVVLGVRTNVTFLQAVAAHPAFARGETTTGFIERHFNAWRTPAASELEWLAMAAWEAWGRQPPQAATSEASAFDPWNAADRWRNA